MLEIALLTNILTFCFCCWLFFLHKKSCSVYSPMFWYLFFHFLVFLLRPGLGLIISLPIAWNYMGIQPSEFDLSITHFVVSIALLCFSIGYYAFLDRRRTVFSDRVRDETGRSITPRVVLLMWIILGPLSIYSAAYTGYGASLGDVNYIQMARVNGVAVNTNSNGYLLDLQFTLIGLCLMTLIGFRFRWYSFIPVVAFMAYRSFMGGGRWSIILTAAGAGMIYLFSKKKKWPKIWIVVPIIPLFAIFAWLGQNRSLVKGLLFGGLQRSGESDLADGLLLPFQGLDFANFDYLTYVLNVVPGRTGTLTYGLQYLQILTEPIPRIWWAGKPAGAPIQVFDLNSYGNFLGLTVSVVGDAWMTGGLIGVVILMFCYGAIFSKIYSWFMKENVSEYSATIYLCFCALCVQLFRDGSIVSAVKFPALVLLPVLAASVVGRMRLRRAS